MDGNTGAFKGGNHPRDLGTDDFDVVAPHLELLGEDDGVLFGTGGRRT